MSWKTHEHTLAHPITLVEGEGDKAVRTTYKKIVLREPDVEALETISELDLPRVKDGEDMPLTIRQLRVIITAIADQPEAVIRKLHRDDFSALSDEAVPLLRAPDKPPASPPSAAPGDSSATE